MEGSDAESPTVRFAALVQGPEEEIALDEAAFLLAAHASPGLDVAGQRKRLDEIAAAVPEPTLDALVRHLFDTCGFAGDVEHYGDPRNSYLDAVLDRRRGIPITLSVVTMEVGRRVGLRLSGVGMPGHFLVRHDAEPRVFLDPFAGGVALDAAGAEARFRRTAGEGAAFDPAYLAPVGPRAILARMLANLKQTARATGDLATLDWVVRLRVAVPGVLPGELAELAQAQAAQGQFHRAAAALEDLATRVDPAQAPAVLAAATRARARLN